MSTRQLFLKNAQPNSPTVFPDFFANCAVPENIHTPPTEGIGISWREGGSLRPNDSKKCMELNWNFQRGGEVLREIPSMGEVSIFSGTTQFKNYKECTIHLNYY